MYNNFMAKLKSEFLIPYENKWVALTLDNKKVIASADDLGDLYDKLQKMRIKKNKVVLDFVRPFDVYLAP